MGDRPSLADAALWPFVRQWRIADPEGFDNDTTLEALRSWLQRFLEDPRFERLMQRADPRGLRNAGDASALIEQNDGAFKHHLDRFKYTDRYPGTNKEEQRAAGLAILQNWDQRIADQGWLLGERCSLADAALWPFVRQWRIADPEGFDNDNSLEALRRWLQRFLEDLRFERLMQLSLIHI